MKKAGRVPRMGRGGCDTILRDSDGEKFFDGGVAHGSLTESADWGTFQL